MLSKLTIDELDALVREMTNAITRISFAIPSKERQNYRNLIRDLHTIRFDALCMINRRAGGMV